MHRFDEAQKREVVGSASFSVSARVAMQLGRESIANSIVGILELIKNAYDADAEKVVLHFLDLDSDFPTLVIDDDGHGMTEKALVDNWLVIGTDNKVRKNHSRHKGRALTGEKGLGRLGLDRLCKTTSVQSFTATEEFGIQLEVDWGKYEDTSQRLETIEHPISRLHYNQLRSPATGKLFTKEHGTRLILTGLKDTWTAPDIERLRAELALLVSPFAGPADFSINLYARGERHKIDSTEMIKAAEWTLEASITDTGYVAFKMTGQHGEEFDFSGAWRSVFPELNRELASCGPLEFIMYFIPRRSTKSLSFTKSQIDTFMEANQGIRIYRDGFRVMPYGSPSGEGDWLTLAYRRMQNPAGRSTMSWRVGYNQVIGAVFITRDRNEELLDQTNREGIVEGSAFAELKIFASRAIEWFERNQVAAFRRQSNITGFNQKAQEAKQVTEEALSATSDLEVVVSDAISALERSAVSDAALSMDDIKLRVNSAMTTVKEKVEQTIKVQDKLTTAHEEVEQQFEREKDTLQNLASLGILAVAFGHETLAHTNRLAGNAYLLKSTLTASIFHEIDAKTKGLIEESINDISHSSKRIGVYGNFMLRNMRRDKRKRTKVYVDKVFKDVFKPFALKDTRSVHVIKDFPQQVPPILAFVVDWESIAVNLLTNALWALQPVQERIIRVRIREADSRLNVWFADSGHGISKGIIDHIFEPGFTTKRNERGDNIGTGMGLAIVEDLVKSYSGSIRALSTSELGGAEFHIQVPIPKLAARGR